MNKPKRSPIGVIIIGIICLILNAYNIIHMLKTDNGFDKSEPLYYIGLGFFIWTLVLIVVVIKKSK